jgi:hypothetical protein
MLTTAGTVQQQFRAVVHISCIGIQNEVAYPLSQRCTSRFSSEHHVVTVLLKPLEESLGLGGRSRPIDAFEDDEEG